MADRRMALPRRAESATFAAENRNSGGPVDGSPGGPLLLLRLLLARLRPGVPPMTVVRVSGDSMVPALRDGDHVLVRRVRYRRVRTGDIIVAECPSSVAQSGTPEPDWTTPAPASASGSRNWIVKRVAAIAGDDVPGAQRSSDPAVPPRHLFVVGDNPAESFDSRHFGLLPEDRMLGVVIRKMRI